MRATPWRHAVAFVCGRDVASHRFPLFRCQTAHTSVRGDLSLIPATAWRGCVKQIGKWLSETQWLIEAPASRTQSRSCAPGLTLSAPKDMIHVIKTRSRLRVWVGIVHM